MYFNFIRDCLDCYVLCIIRMYYNIIDANYECDNFKFLTRNM